MEDNTLDLFQIDHSKYGGSEPVAEEAAPVVLDETIDPITEDPITDPVIEDPAPTTDPETPPETPPTTVVDEEVVELSEFGTVISALVNNNIVDYDEEAEYEESEAGIQDLIKTTVEKRVQAGIAADRESLDPKAKQFLEHLNNGGSVEHFKEDAEEVDFSTIDLVDSEGNEKTQIQEYLVEDLLKLQNYTDDEIADTLKGYKEAGMLHKQSDIAKRKLAAHQTTVRQERIQAREAEAARASQKAIEESKNFETKVLATRSIADFNISEVEAKKLHSFITVKDKTGKTAFEKVNTEENSLLYAYFAMSGFNKEKLTKEVATKQAITLKKKLANYKDSQTNPKRGGANPSTKKTDNKIHWDI